MFIVLPAPRGREFAPRASKTGAADLCPGMARHEIVMGTAMAEIELAGQKTDMPCVADFGADRYCGPRHGPLAVTLLARFDARWAVSLSGFPTEREALAGPRIR